MKHQTLFRWLAAATVIGAGSANAQGTVTELVPPSADCSAQTINESGQVLFHCNVLPYVWMPTTQTFTPVLPPNAAGISYIRATAMNNSGKVAGNYCWSSGLDCAKFTWSPAEGWVSIATPQERYEHVFAFNDVGQMLYSGYRGGQYATVVREPTGVENRVNEPPYYMTWLNKSVLNNLGQVPVINPATGRLGIWQAGSVTMLPDTPFSPAWVEARALNDAGVLAGFEGPRGGFVYSPSTGYTLLPAGTVPAHINALGQLSGQAHLPTGGTAAVFWRTPTDRLVFPYPAQENPTAQASNSQGDVLVTADNGKAFIWKIAPPAPPTPSQRLADIDAALTSYVSAGVVASTDVKGLTSKLTAVAKSLEKGEATAAKNVLMALRNQVEALEKSKRISASAAADLKSLVDSAWASIA